MLVHLLTAQTLALEFFLQRADLVPDCLYLRFHITTCCCRCKHWRGRLHGNRLRRCRPSWRLRLQRLQLIHERLMIVQLLPGDALALELLLQCADLVANRLDLSLNVTTSSRRHRRTSVGVKETDGAV